MRLQYIRHEDIDVAAWDEALAQCGNRLVYAQSAYLNCMAVHWDAVVGGNYELLLPLPVNSKLGIRYSPVIPFIQQLGVFTKQPVSQELMEACITLATRHIRYGDFLFNHTNTVANGLPKANFVLALNDGYERLSANYSKDLRNNLKQAAKHGLVYRDAAADAAIIDLFQQMYREQLPHVLPLHYDRLHKLYGHYRQTERVVCRQVYLENRLVAGAVLVVSDQRLYNILSVNTPEGRQCSANHFLYDQLIQEFAGQPVLLDFEGSDVPGIASFYQNFGSVNQPYYSLHVNRLPWPLRMVKK